MKEKSTNPDEIIEKLEADPVSQGKSPGKQKQSKESKAIRDISAFAHSVNRAGRDYTETDIVAQCETYLVNKNTVEDIFSKIFDEYQEEFGIEDKPEIAKVEVYLKRKYDFLFNEITQRLEYKLNTDKEWKPFNEHTIFRDLQHSQFKFTLEKIKSLFKTDDFVESHNPILDYFRKLPKWNEGDTDYIAGLAGYIETDDQEFFIEQFRKALIRNIACGLTGFQNRIVFTLVGRKQETGKSTFIRYLNPFGDKYYTESPLRDDKDSEISLCENFIYNLEELAHISYKNVNKLKAIISKGVIKERKAYAHDAKEQPRRCSFWASTNDEEFLTDIENTRWLCFNVKSISHDYHNIITGKSQVDINRVWAQAYALYESGYPYVLDMKESQRRDDRNKGYEVGSDEKEIIMRYFKHGTEDDGYPLMINEIMEYIYKQLGTNNFRFNRIAMGRALTQLGYTNKRARRVDLDNKVSNVYYMKYNLDIRKPEQGDDELPGSQELPQEELKF